MGERWNIVELVEWGLNRREHAERDGLDWITVWEIHRGATRIGNSIEKFDCIVRWQIEQWKAQGIAFVVLKRKRGGPVDGSWVVYDYGNVDGDRVTVNAALSTLRLTEATPRA